MVCPVTCSFAALGGRAALQRVNRVVYDKVYADPWLSRFFTEVAQQHIEDPQTDFMRGALGGAKVFRGHTPRSAHRHMFISQELFERRYALLRDALDEAGVCPELRTRWLEVDAAFRCVVTKQDPGRCRGRNALEGVVVIARPPGVVG